MSEAVIVAIFGALGVIIAALITWIATRGKTKTDALSSEKDRIDAAEERLAKRQEAELESRWKEVDDLKERVDAVEARERKKMGAVARIFRAIARQWPTPEGPDLDPADIAEIEETIPPAWFRKPTPQKENPS